MTNPKAFIHIQKLHAANFPFSHPLNNPPSHRYQNPFQFQLPFEYVIQERQGSWLPLLTSFHPLWDTRKQRDHLEAPFTQST
jgi:hypothetical protein